MPHTHKHKEYLELIASEINKRLPDNHGFILMAVPYNPDGREQTINYVANCQRADALRLMRTFIASQDGKDGMGLTLRHTIRALDEGLIESKRAFDAKVDMALIAAQLVETLGVARNSLRSLIG